MFIELRRAIRSMSGCQGEMMLGKEILRGDHLAEGSIAQVRFGR